MFRRISLILTTFLLGFGILFTTIFSITGVKYAFSQNIATPSPEAEFEVSLQDEQIDYIMPYPGGILPDHPLWPVKVIRDKAWLFFTFNTLKKAELSLLMADKRVAAAKVLFEKNKPELGVSTLVRAEAYCKEAVLLEEIARKDGVNTTSFLLTLANASLKHRQITEEIFLIAPDDAKEKVLMNEDHSKKIYSKSKEYLNGYGIVAPNDPFND